MKDYYNILELDRSATLSEIRTNYKRLVKEVRLRQNQANAAHDISELVEAYVILKSPLSKRKYDITIDNQISSSKKRRKTFSSSSKLKYEKILERRAAKSKKKVKRLLAKSDQKLEKDFSVGDTIFSGIEIFDFVLNLLFSIFD